MASIHNIYPILDKADFTVEHKEADAGEGTWMAVGAWHETYEKALEEMEQAHKVEPHLDFRIVRSTIIVNVLLQRRGKATKKRLSKTARQVEEIKSMTVEKFLESIPATKTYWSSKLVGSTIAY